MGFVAWMALAGGPASADPVDAAVRIHATTGRTSSLSRLPDGRLLTHSGSQANLWDLETGEVTALPGGRCGPFLPESGAWVAVDVPGAVVVHDTRSGEEIGRYEMPDACVRGASPDGRWVAVSTWKSARDLQLVSPYGAPGPRLPLRGTHFGRPPYVAFSPDSTAVLVTVAGGRGLQFDLTQSPPTSQKFVSGVSRPSWLGPGQPVTNAHPVRRYSPSRLTADGRHILGWSHRELRAWDTASTKPIFAEAIDLVESADVSGDGTRVVVSARGSGLRVWDIASDDVVGTSDLTGRVRFLPSGQIVSTHDDGVVRFWSPELELLALVTTDRPGGVTVVDPATGHHASSRQGVGRIGVRAAGHDFELEQLPTLAVDDLLRKLLEGRPTRSGPALSDLAPPPRVQITGPDAKGRIELKAVDQGGGVGQWWLRADDRDVTRSARRHCKRLPCAVELAKLGPASTTLSFAAATQDGHVRSRWFVRLIEASRPAWSGPWPSVHPEGRLLPQSPKLPTVLVDDNRKALLQKGDQAVMWDVATGRTIDIDLLPGHLRDLSPDRRTGTLLREGSDQMVRWDFEAQRADGELPVMRAISADGSRGLRWTPRRFELWDLVEPRETAHWPRTRPGYPPRTPGHPYVRFSPDGEAFFVWTPGRVEVRESTRGRLEETFDGRKGPAWLPDGRLVLRNEPLVDPITLGDFRSRPAIHLGASDADVGPFSDDGRYLALVSVVGEASLWDTQTLSRRIWLGGEGRPRVSLSPDGRFVVSVARQSNEGGLWDVWSGQRLAEVVVTSAFQVLFPTDGAPPWLWHGETVERFDRNGARMEPQTLPRGSRGLSELVVAPDGDSFVWVTGGRTFRYGRDGVVALDRGAGTRAASAWFSPDGSRIFSPGGSKGVSAALFDARDGSLIRRFDAFSGGSQSVFSPDGRWFAVHSQDQPVHVLDARTGELRKVLGSRSVGASVVGWLAGNDDVVLLSKRQVFVWNLERQEVVGEPVDRVDRAVLTVSGELVYASRSDIGWVDLKTGARREPLRVAADVLRLQLSPDGRRLLLQHPAGNWSLWNVERREELATLSGMHAELSPDGTWVASYGHDVGVVEVHGTVDGQLAHRLTEHYDHVRFLGFTRNGRHLFTGSLDGAVRLWTLDDGELRTTFMGLDDGSWAVADPKRSWDGVFEGDFGGMHWVEGDNVVTLGELGDEHHVPGLFHRRLAGSERD